MAGDKLSSEELALQPLDLDAFDEFLDGPTSGGKEKGSFRRFTTSFKRGFMEQATSRNMLRSFMRTALPDGYSRLIGAYDDTEQTLREIGADLEQRHARELESIAVTMQEKLPNLKRRTSEKLYSKLEEKLRQTRERFAMQREYNQDPAIAAKQREQENEEAMLRDILDGASKVQVDIATAQEEAAADRFAYDVETQGIQSAIDRERFGVLSKALGSIVVSQQKQVAFQDQVTYRYQRKGLELSFRTLMAIRSMNKLQEAQLKLNKDAYTALVRNTGLPDHLKSTKAEQMRFNLAQGGSNRLTQKFYDNLPMLMANFAPGIRENLTQMGGNAIQGLSGALGMGAGAGGMLVDQFNRDRAGTVGNVAGRLTAAGLQRLLMPMVARRTRQPLEQASNRYLGGLHNRLSYGLDNMPALLQEFANDPANQGGIRGYMSGALRSVSPQFALNTRVANGNYQTIGQQSAFNQLTQRSIVDIIPGYLARILQEQRMMRTGSEDVALPSYDVVRGEFTDRSTALGRIQKRVVSGGAARSMGWALNEALNTYDNEGELSAEARHALSERLLRDASTNKRFDPKRYSTAEGYGQGTSDEVLTELSGFFKRKFTFDAAGNIEKSAENAAVTQRFSQSFIDIRNMTQDPINEINRLLEMGNIGALRELGIVHTVDNEDRINYDRLWALYREGVSDSNEYPDAPGEGPRGPDMGPDYGAGVRQRFGQAKDRVSALLQGKGPSINGFGGPLDLSAFGTAATDLQARARTLVEDTAEQATDLYTSAKEDVLVKAAEIRNGDLIDVNTQKVIESVEDITGVVTDRVGRVRISLGDLRDGLTTALGKPVRLPNLRAVVENLTTGTRSIFGSMRARFTKMFQREDGIFSRVKDLYLDQTKEPVILARDMSQGVYIDVNTQTPILTVDDITGAVADSRTDQIVVTEEEAKRGFFDVEGFKVIPSKIMRGVGRFLNLTTRPGVWAIKTAGRALAALGGGIYRMLGGGEKDAYLPGETEPVLTARNLRKGKYYHSDGLPIQRFNEIRDAVYDEDGQVLVSSEQRAQLLNKDGSKHIAAKRTRGLQNLVGRAVRGAGRGYWNMTKKYYGWLGRKAMDPFNKKINRATGQTEEVVDESKLDSPTDTILSRILGTLKERLPGSGPKEGSWQEQLASKDAAAKSQREGLRTKGDAAEKGGLFGGLKGILNLFRKNEAEEEEEDSNGDIYVDNSGGEDGKKRKRRTKPKGRLGKAWDRMSKSRVGRIGGSLARGAGTLGRGALIMGADAMLGAGAGSAIASGAGAAGAALMGGLGTAASFAGTALAGAGTALLGIVTSPAWLTAAGVAAVAGGAYWLYSRHRDTSGDFRSYRLLQYGINSTSLGLKVLEVESLLEGVTTKGDHPEINWDKETADKVLSALGIDQDEPEKIAQFARWCDLRFKPVFFAYLKAVHQLAQGSVAINELDDKFPEGQKAALLEMVKVGSGPYSVLISPDGDSDPLEVTPEEIQAKYAELKAKYGKLSANTPISTPTAVTAATLAAAPATGRGAVGGSPMAVPPLAAEASRTVGAPPLGMLAPALISGAVIPMVKFNQSSLSALQSIRMRAYGLGTVDTKNVQAILSAEAYLFGGLTYTQSGQAEFGGDTQTLLQDLSPLFGISTQDPLDPQRLEFIKWVYYRFTPTFLTFAAAVHAQDNSISTLDSIETKLSAASKVAIANSVMTATADLDGSKVSVWTQRHIFDASFTAEALKTMAKADLGVLNQLAEKEKIATPTQSARMQQARGQGSGVTKAGDVQSQGLMSRAADMLSGFGSAVANTAQNMWGGVKSFFGFGDNESTGTGSAGTPYQPGSTPTYGGPLIGSGNAYEGFASGTGGVFEKIPLPTSNKSRDAAMATLKAVQAMTGVDAELLATFCSIESGFNYLIKAPTSSATGWFQFIDNTWDEMIRKHGSKYGIPANDPQRALRRDPRVNALMGAEFLKSNYAYLAGKIGRAPTDVDLYCAHFFGPGGASQFLRADPNAFGALVFPKQAASNASIFYKGPGAPRTIREIYQLFEAKVAKHRKGGGTNILLQKAANDAGPLDVATAQAEAVAKGETQTDTPNADGKAAGDNGTVGVMAAAPNVSQQVNKTAKQFPLSASVMRGTGTPTTPALGPVVATPVDETEEMQRQQEAAQAEARRVAQAAQAKSSSMKENMDHAKATVDIQKQQLQVQTEMRDFLKTIAQNMGVNMNANQPAANGMEKRSPGTQERRVGNSRSPIDVSR